MTEKNPLDSVLFITLPENFKIPNGAFPIDVTIPIPVQRSDNQNSQETFDISKLSWEMIIAGMLLILAYDKNNKNIQYYRSLVKAVKPDIKKELTEAAILKSKNEDFDIAEEIFSALRGLEPEDPITMVNSALFYDERGSSYRRSSLNEDADACDDLANTYYTQAMLLEPPVPNAFFNAGFFYLKQRNFKRAKEVFETYCSLISSLSECELPENEKYKIKRAKEVIADISTRNLEDELFKTAYELISNGEEEKGLTSIKAFLEKKSDCMECLVHVRMGFA